MPGKKGMPSPRYSQEMKDEIRKMIEAGKTQQTVAEYFGLKDRTVVHQVLKRERRKQENTTILPKKRGRSPAATPKTIEALKEENKRLRMENELMKSFLELVGRG